MFFKTGEYIPDIPLKYADRVTSLLKTEDALWIGREDGLVEIINGPMTGLIKAFDLEFDCLENEDIKEKINSMALMTDGGVNNILFVGNEKNLKVFQIRNDVSTLSICNREFTDKFRINEIDSCKNVHSYILNSISLNASRDFMITSDYIKVNLWRPGRLESTFSLIDIKSQIASGCIYVINTSKFSPYQDSVFGYSSSSGELSLNDISISPKSQKIQSFRNSYTQSIKSISDFVFIDSNFILTRSMNNLCLFDQRNSKKEVYITELVTSTDEQNMLNSCDAVYDRFKLDCSGHMAYTGSYNGSVYCFDLLNSSLEEINVIDGVKSLNENKIKNVAAENEGFSCVANGRVKTYKIKQ